MTSISSRDNPKLRWLRRLAESRGRRRSAEQFADRIGRSLQEHEDLLLLEGPHLIDAALSADVELLQVFCTTEPNPAVASLQARLDHVDRVPERFEVPGALLHGAVEAETSQGICALAVVRRRDVPRPDVTAGVFAVWLDRLRDPGNVGAVLRVAEAAGARVVGISHESASWRHPRALRASAGSALRLSVRSELAFGDFRAEVDAALGRECRWLGLSARGEPLLAGGDLEEAPPDGEPAAGPLGIALGSESHGLAPDVEQACDGLAAIDMEPPVESLNVAVAAGIALYLLRTPSRG